MALLQRGAASASDSVVMRLHLQGCSACAKKYAAALDERSAASGGEPPAAPSVNPDIDATLERSPPSSASPWYPAIEGYRLTGVLGQGGMGIVYRATQTTLNRTVALKVLPAVVGSANPSAVARFRREATAAAKLHHTNIIPIYDFGESHDAYYYAMELISGKPLNVLIGQFAELNLSSASPAKLGETLHALTSELAAFALDSPSSSDRGADAGSGAGLTASGRGRPYFSQVARWMADAADALHFAHGQGIIHRDIKPANLILSGDGRIMVADFGLAKSTEEASVTLTGAFLGSLRYVSPEQAMAKRVRVDHRTDIYSLGATFYELLTFQPAFPGSDEKEILGAIISRDPTPARKIVPFAPYELETICLKMMEKDPNARYATARAAAEDLRRYLNDLPIVARRPGPAARAVKFARRHRAPVIAVAAAVLLSLSGVVIVRERRHSRVLHVVGLIEAGKAGVEARNWEVAAERYAEAIALDERNVAALFGLAHVRKEQFNQRLPQEPRLLEEAAALCDRALALSSAEAQVWNLKGILLKKMERYPEATQAYMRAAELNPADPLGWSNLGVIHALSHDLDAAEKTFRRAMELSPSACRVPRAVRNLASIQLLRRDARAMETILVAVDCDKRELWSRLVRARIRLTLPTHLNPQWALQDALVADGYADQKEPIAQRMLGWSSLRVGELEQADDSLQRAIQLGDAPTVNQLLLALIGTARGKGEAAREQLALADQSWPAELKTKGAYRVREDNGGLWFESADELFELRAEVERFLNQAP